MTTPETSHADALLQLAAAEESSRKATSSSKSYVIQAWLDVVLSAITSITWALNQQLPFVWSIITTLIFVRLIWRTNPPFHLSYRTPLWALITLPGFLGLMVMQTAFERSLATVRRISDLPTRGVERARMAADALVSTEQSTPTDTTVGAQQSGRRR